MASPKPVQKRPLLVAVLLLYGVLGFWYSLAAPPFETPDEPFHYAFARHLAQGNGLPVQRADAEGPWAQEGSQAPLYYMLTGLLTRFVDQSDYAALATRNPRANIGDPLYLGNKNFMLYSAATHPLRGANLALHVGRWFSLLLGGLTVFFTFATARLALPNRQDLAIASALFVALIPQFLFLSASFSNDNLIITASAATVYWLARLLAQSHSRSIRMREWLVLGCLLGMAALSKLHGLGLFGLAALGGLWIMGRRRDWRLPLRALAPVALPTLLIAGWWYWRNHTLYGDWLGIQHLLEINGQREKSLSWRGLWGELRGLRYSFWGLFGWFNIPLPTWVYAVFDGVAVLGIVGQVAQLAPTSGKVRDSSFLDERASWETRPTHSGVAVLWLLAAWIVLSLGLLAYWIMQATGSQGRLLFPALSALAILLVWGLDGWLQMLMRWSGLPLNWRRLQEIYWGGLAACMVGCSLYVLLFLFPTAYGAPAPAAHIPDDAQHVNVAYGDAARGQDVLRLLALAVGDGRYVPGDAAPVTLYLTADAPMRADYQLFIQFLDGNGEPLANLTSHPGWGRNPTSLWTPGAIYADAYQVRIDKPIGSDSPLLARVYTGFITPSVDDADLRPMTARNAAGDEITPALASVAIRPWRGPDLDALRAEAQAADQKWTPMDAQFGGAVALRGLALPAQIASGAPSLSVMLVWGAAGQPAADYTAYVHLLDESGGQVAGFDQPPSPHFPTGHWRADDEIVSRFALPLPPELPTGRYQAWLGLYESASQGAMRLPVEEAPGINSANGELLLGELVVK
ncbi:MAG: DUF2142 domain-containing protein [Caldilineaceae bacterium]